jgi:hypothetical protein
MISLESPDTQICMSMIQFAVAAINLSERSKFRVGVVQCPLR